MHALKVKFAIEELRTWLPCIFRDFTKNGQRYDLILDIAAHHSIFDYKRALSPKGIYAIVGGSRATIFQAVLLGPLISMTGSKKMGLMMWKPNRKEDFVFIKELIESGKVVPVIDRCYPLSEVAEALRYFEEGHSQGKVVITVDHIMRAHMFIVISHNTRQCVDKLHKKMQTTMEVVI